MNTNYPLLVFLLIVTIVQCSLVEITNRKLTQIEFNTRSKP